MYERLLDKKVIPSIDDLIIHCGENSSRFAALNSWLSSTYGTEQAIVFPYGNQYGWGISHRIKRKLICNIFAEKGAFTVMLRLSNQQFEAVSDQLSPYTQQYIDNKYPCGDGGWIHYRILNEAHLADIQKLLATKCPNNPQQPVIAP